METPRLRLIRDTPAMARAQRLGQPEWEAALGHRLAAGMMDFSQGVAPERERALVSGTANPWLYGLWAVHKAEGLVIGAGGFRAPPDADGVVEIAYGIAPAYQGRGFATEIATALVEFVSQSGEARTARAHTLPQENPSAGVLRKCGFQCLGEVLDPEDGPVWRWEKALDTPTGPLPKADGGR